MVTSYQCKEHFPVTILFLLDPISTGSAVLPGHSYSRCRLHFGHWRIHRHPGRMSLSSRLSFFLFLIFVFHDDVQLINNIISYLCWDELSRNSIKTSTITILWSCHVINLVIFPIFYVQILTVTGYEIRRHLYL